MLFQCPKLTPLQARLTAAVSTLLLMCLIYWTLVSPPSAYASELTFDGTGSPRNEEDHNWHRLRDEVVVDEEIYDEEEKRASVVANQAVKQYTELLGNNIGTPQNLEAGNLTLWRYPNTLLQLDPVGLGAGLPSELSALKEAEVRHLELKKRQSDSAQKQIFISATTCLQPIWNATGVQTGQPPQLTLWVSTASGNTNLGPTGDMSRQQNYTFVNGFVNATIYADGDWFMAVSAPSLPEPVNFTGEWNYQLAVSLDDYFFAANQDILDPFLFQIDTDTTAALLVTQNLTTTSNTSDPIYQQWMSLSPPFVLFAVNDNITETAGMESSFCALSSIASRHRQIQAEQTDLDGSITHVKMDMITRGTLNYPKEQFYITSLNSSTSYKAYLALNGNSTANGDGVVGGGGKVWTSVPFTTKTDGNCQLIYNLDFCSAVAYAVPSNPLTQPDLANLRAIYDSTAATWYQNFTYTLAQIPCNTTADAQYSLAANCTSCASAYKDWLCAVLIPRCDDFSNDAHFLQIRNVGQEFWSNGSKLDDEFLNTPYRPMHRAPTLEGSSAFGQTYISSFATNQSRNPVIDEKIRPGPYKEVLPCEDLCYGLMQNCPAAMNFACPYPGRGLEVGYGRRNVTGLNCNYPGAVFVVNGGDRGVVRWGLVAIGLLVAIWEVW